MPRDDFDSRQVARIIDLISEGEIEGFPSASGLTVGTDAYHLASLKDTFFNNTPVLGVAVAPAATFLSVLSVEPPYKKKLPSLSPISAFVTSVLTRVVL